MEGSAGLLGSRATAAVDVAYLLLLAIVPLFVWSLEALLVRRNYLLHKRIQLALTPPFLIASGILGCDFLLGDWRQRAVKAAGEAIAPVTLMTLAIHVAFLATSLLIWVVLFFAAIRRIPNPPGPCKFGPTYLFWIVLLGLQTFLAMLTGWEFYMLAYCF